MKYLRKYLSRNRSIMRLIVPLRSWSTVIYRSASNATHQYAIFVPRTVTTNKRTPLIVALHGRQGTIYEFAFTNIARFAKTHSYIIACPSGKDGVFYTPEAEHDVLEVINHVKSEHCIDENRVYLLGVSMGGRGTTYIGLRNPHLFAAIAPMYGTSTGGELSCLTENSKKIPVFAVHGTLDDVVPVAHSKELVSRLNSRGYECALKLIEGLGHDIRALDTALPEIFGFFQLHARNGRLA